MESFDKVFLVTGDRKYSNINNIREVLSKYKNNKCLLIHGACKGADLLAHQVATELNFTIQSFPANWNKYGKAAGPMRNMQMLTEMLKYKREGMETFVLAFHDNIAESRGTKNCIKCAMKYGFNVELFGSSITDI